MPCLTQRALMDTCQLWLPSVTSLTERLWSPSAGPRVSQVKGQVMAGLPPVGQAMRALVHLLSQVCSPLPSRLLVTVAV